MPLLERSKLYQDVWSRPCTKIAAELGISSIALKRICTEMEAYAQEKILDLQNTLELLTEVVQFITKPPA